MNLAERARKELVDAESDRQQREQAAAARMQREKEAEIRLKSILDEAKDLLEEKVLEEARGGQRDVEVLTIDEKSYQEFRQQGLEYLFVDFEESISSQGLEVKKFFYESSGFDYGSNYSEKTPVVTWRAFF
jgi:hypothetical protein